MKHQDQLKSRGQLLQELAAARRQLDELESSADRHRGTEAALRAREAEMRAIIDVLPDLVIRVHRDGTFLDVKSPSQDILSRPAEEIVGCDIRDTDLPETVIAAHLSAMDAALRTRAVHAFEYPLEVRRGLRVFEGRTVACSADEVLILIRDITEAKRAGAELRGLEAQLYQARRMASIGRVAGGVAHNLNNLLTPILSYVEMLLDGGTGPESQQQHLQAILEAADDASALVQELLAAGSEQEHEVRRIDLGRIAVDYQPILRRAIREDVYLEVRRPHSPLWIDADRSQIQQVLLNLGLNAQDAIRGRGRVVIESRETVVGESPGGAMGGEPAQPALRPGRYGSLRVSDDGCGIDVEIREQVFEPFFTTRESAGGTGLGLASVLGIIQQHGGEIRLESAVGKGSTFELLFPLCVGADKKIS